MNESKLCTPEIFNTHIKFLFFDYTINIVNSLPAYTLIQWLFYTKKTVLNTIFKLYDEQIPKSR